MWARRKRNDIQVLVPVLLCLLSLSCGKDKKPTAAEIEDAKYLPQSSPANILENLRRAYTTRNTAQYEKLFSADFVFFFTLADVHNPNNPTPSEWDLAAELQSADSLLRTTSVQKIELTFQRAEPVPGEGEMVGSQRVDMTEINLGIDTRGPGGVPLRMLVTSGKSVFHFRAFPGELARDGNTLWRIVRWTDAGISTEGKWDGTENWNWGAVKHRFSRP